MIPNLRRLPSGALLTLSEATFKRDADGQPEDRVATIKLTVPFKDDGDIEDANEMLPGAGTAIRAGLTDRLTANLDCTSTLPSVQLRLATEVDEDSIIDLEADVVGLRFAVRGPVSTATYSLRVHGSAGKLTPLLVHLGDTVRANLQARGQLDLPFGRVQVEGGAPAGLPRMGAVVSTPIPGGDGQAFGLVVGADEGADPATYDLRDLDGTVLTAEVGAQRSEVQVVGVDGGDLDEAVAPYLDGCAAAGWEPSWSHLLVALGRTYGGGGVDPGPGGTYALTRDVVAEALRAQAQELGESPAEALAAALTAERAEA